MCIGVQVALCAHINIDVTPIRSFHFFPGIRMTKSDKEAIAKKGSNDVCYKLSDLFLRTCFVFVSLLLCSLIPAIPIQ